jgi:cysteine desulfurase
MTDYIYADNAATTKLDMDAFEAMKLYVLEEYGNASQPYSFSKRPKMALKRARKDIADCIGAKPEEIFFTSGGSESDNWVLREFGVSMDIRHIITSNIEHHAILNTCESEAKKKRCDVRYLNVNEKGLVSPDEVNGILSETREYVTSCENTLISIMYANNEIGTMQPIKEICKIAHEHGAKVHTDAVQAVGHVKINVKALGVDYLSASAHKFNGPKGIGFLYICDMHLSSLISGGAQEKGLRAGTENVAAIVGMATALKNNIEEIDSNIVHLKKLENIFLLKLREAKLDFIRNGINQLPGNISVSFADAEGEMLLHRLDLKKICISTGSACNSVNTQVSHVIKAIKVPEKYAKGTIRISLGRDNSEEEVVVIADAIASILKG